MDETNGSGAIRTDVNDQLNMTKTSQMSKISKNEGSKGGISIKKSERE